MTDSEEVAGRPDAQIDHSASIAYWTGINADADGMLGGLLHMYPHLSRLDLQASRAFMAKVGVVAGKGEEVERRLERAVDCGAGIGRITVGLLLSLSTTVDIVEPVAKFTENLAGVSGVGDVYNVGLESWEPPAEKTYDLIWNQWCVGHLTDVQLVSYLQRCKGALRKEDGKSAGWIFLKENLTKFGDVYDEVDSSVTRTEEKFKQLFTEAGLKIMRTELQKGFPKSLYPVRMWALQPAL